MRMCQINFGVFSGSKINENQTTMKIPTITVHDVFSYLASLNLHNIHAVTHLPSFLRNSKKLGSTSTYSVY